MRNWCDTVPDENIRFFRKIDKIWTVIYLQFYEILNKKKSCCTKFSAKYFSSISSSIS